MDPLELKDLDKFIQSRRCERTFVLGCSCANVKVDARDPRQTATDRRDAHPRALRVEDKYYAVKTREAQPNRANTAKKPMNIGSDAENKARLWSSLA